MKIIKPSVEFFGAVPTDPDLALKFIEMAGRTCYKSEDKITKDSAKKFVKRLIQSGHLAMVEHSNFVVRTPQTMFTATITGKFLNVFQNVDYIYVGGSLTAWYQRGNIVGWSAPIYKAFISQYADLFNITLFDPIDYSWKVCPHNEIPKELHRYSAKFICDRGVSHELVRHRPCSFAQESTRYVSYKGVRTQFIEPVGFDQWNDRAKDVFSIVCTNSEESYNQLLAQGLSPQQSRAVLPNALKTEIVVTADADEWKHIRKLRTAKDAQPDMQRVMNMMPWEEFL